METMILALKDIETWRIPPFQRPVRINDKVRMLAEELKADGYSISGILTLGKVTGDPSTWVVDGQHRLESFKLSGLTEVLADVRLCKFDTMAEMAGEFVRLNSALVRMRPDDVLRGLESTSPALAFIRNQCEFVGYGSIRRKDSRAAVLGMSSVLRAWFGSMGETPSSGNGSSAAQMADTLDIADAQKLVPFLLTAYSAWGNDPEYYRLWGGLNLTMCMWLYRRLVLDRDRSGVKRYASLNIPQFKQCMMAASASGDYLNWLSGRRLSDFDRSPCYTRLKAIMVKRLMDDAKGGVVPKMPKPAWASN
jgi:hypothetical protein